MPDTAAGASELLAGAPEEFSGIEWAPALPTIASPSWVGGDSIFFEGRTVPGRPRAPARLRPAAMIRVDCTAMFAAMEAAGPPDSRRPCSSTMRLAASASRRSSTRTGRSATLYRLLDEDAVARLAVRVRRGVQEAVPSCRRRASSTRSQGCFGLRARPRRRGPVVADEVIAVRRGGKRECAWRPGAGVVPWRRGGLQRDVERRRRRGSSAGRRPGAWTRSRRSAPCSPSSSPFVADAATVFEAMWGERDPVAFARAQLYGLADDLRWGLDRLVRQSAGTGLSQSSISGTATGACSRPASR